METQQDATAPAPRQRRSFTPAEKSQAVLRLVQDGVPLSKLADELKIQPALLINWRKQLFANAAMAFDKPEEKEVIKARTTIAALEAKINRIEAEKNTVISAVATEMCELKKKLSEMPSRPANGSNRM